MIYGIIFGIFIFSLFIVAPVTLYIVKERIHDTMSIKEEQKIIKLFKKYGIEQTGNGMEMYTYTMNDRYTKLNCFIGDGDKEVRIEVSKEKFKIVFELEPDLNMQKELGISTVKIRTIKNFNKVFKNGNGIIEYFEERIKMKKLENKLKRIEEDF